MFHDIWLCQFWSYFVYSFTLFILIIEISVTVFPAMLRCVVDVVNNFFENEMKNTNEVARFLLVFFNFFFWKSQMAVAR